MRPSDNSGQNARVHSEMKIEYTPIGLIRTPFKDVKSMPIQPPAAKNVKGWVEVWPEYSAGLKDLEGFSHIILLYHFHLSKGFSLQVKPFLDDCLRGVFATRAPKRPNPIGLSVVRLLHITGNIIWIEGVDIVDQTPLLDIKPFIPEFDAPRAGRIGWLTGRVGRVYKTHSDSRFFEY